MALDEQTQNALIAWQLQAAKANDGVRKVLSRTERMEGARERGREIAQHMGRSLSDPASFWATVCAGESQGCDAEAAKHALDYAKVRMAAGDNEYALGSLIGQSQYLSILMVQLLAEAEGLTGQDRANLIKLALQAQRQSAQAIATAAALDKLRGAAAVDVSGG